MNDKMRIAQLEKQLEVMTDNVHRILGDQPISGKIDEELMRKERENLFKQIDDLKEKQRLEAIANDTVDKHNDAHEHLLSRDASKLKRASIMTALFDAIDTASDIKWPNDKSRSDKDLLILMAGDVVMSYLNFRTKIDYVLAICKPNTRELIETIRKDISYQFGGFKIETKVSRLDVPEPAEAESTKGPTDKQVPPKDIPNLIWKYLHTNYNIDISEHHHEIITSDDLSVITMHPPKGRKFYFQTTDEGITQLPNTGKTKLSDRRKRMPKLVADGWDKQKMSKLFNVSLSTIQADLWALKLVTEYYKNHPTKP